MPIASLSVLGPFALAIDEREAPPLPRKTQALLALLAVENRPLARATLADLLWTRSGPQQQQQSLRQAVFMINRRLGSGLVRAEANLLMLDRERIAVDVAAFLAGATAADCVTLERCAGLYRGELLEDVAAVSSGFDDWLLRERVRFAEIAGNTLCRLAEAQAAAGAFDAAVAAARRMLALDELREDAHRLVIGMLAAAGRRSEALRQFDACAELLERELGVTPEAETLVLVHRVRNGDALPADLAENAAGAPAARREPGAPAPVQPSRLPERRILTVLACTIDGLGPIAEQGDPEEAHELAAALRRVCGEIVRRFGGHLNQLSGDALTAYFGYPEAHEDDAERAIRAGLAVAAAVSMPVASLPIGLSARLGIASGWAVVGDIGGFAAIGNETSRAMQYAAAADGNWVVVGPQARRSARGAFAYRPIALLQADSSSQTGQAWRVVGEAPHLGRFARRSSGGLTCFTGRAEDIAMLQRCWRQARAGAGQTVLLVGEPGIGKSRLAYEFQQSLAVQEPFFLNNFASPHHSDSLLFPILAQLERAAGFSAGDSPPQKLAKLSALLGREALDNDLPLLAGLLSVPHADEQGIREMSQQRRKEATFALLHRIVERQAAGRPMLMLWEDVQWLDSLSLELLASEIDRAARRPVLLLITARPDFKPPWHARAQVRQHSPSHLEPADAEVLVRAIADNRLSDTTLRAIVERGDGVPLFLEELVKAELLRTGRGGRTARVPVDLQGLLLERIDVLGLSGRAVAQAAAAIGRSFSYEVLRLVAPPARLDSGLAQLLAAELVFRRSTAPHAIYEFKHALVRDAAYDTVSEPRRRRLHAAIAAALEAHFPAIVETQPGLLARHHEQAGETSRAVDYRIAAARRALMRSVAAEARRQIDAAFGLLAELADDKARDRKELVARMLDHRVLLMTNGRAAPEVRRTLQRARDLSEALDDQQQTPAIIFAQWYTSWSAASYVEATGHAEALLRWAKAHLSPTCETFAHYALGMCRQNDGRIREARAHLETAHALNRFDGAGWILSEYWAEGVVQVVSQLHLEICLALLGRRAAAARRADEARTAEQRMTHPYAQGLALLLHCRRLALLRDPQRLLEVASALEELAGREGYPDLPAHALAYRGWALAMTGEVKRGLELVRSGIDRAYALGYLVWHSQMLMMLAECEWHAGNSEQALCALSDAEQFIEQTGERILEAELQRLKGEFLAAQDARSCAEAAFAAAAAVAAAQGVRLLEERITASRARMHAGREVRSCLGEVVAPAPLPTPCGNC